MRVSLRQRLDFTVSYTIFLLHLLVQYNTPLVTLVVIKSVVHLLEHVARVVHDGLGANEAHDFRELELVLLREHQVVLNCFRNKVVALVQCIFGFWAHLNTREATAFHEVLVQILAHHRSVKHFIRPLLVEHGRVARFLFAGPDVCRTAIQHYVLIKVMQATHHGALVFHKAEEVLHASLSAMQVE